MASITIKNVGPIKNVEIELNKVNVFMGPQSSGKSTIAKIISYCKWVEKRYMLDGFFRDDYYERLKTYHNFEDTYFINDDAQITYEGDYYTIEFLKEKLEVQFFTKDHTQSEKFDNRKQIFIPAERNFVASIQNLGRYKETNNNIMDFLYYWYEAKKHYTKSNILNIPTLGISFYHIQNEDKDMVVLDEGKEIILQNASSGFQSMIPLYLLMDYLTNILYKKEIILSPFEIEQIRERAKAVSGSNKEVTNSTIELHRKRLNYNYSQFIIEEPEQNLFPSTQRDLVYHLLQLITGERDHQLTITTHSPYILYALNNCMLGHLVNSQLKNEEKNEYLANEFLSKQSWIDPKSVSIWEIEDGELRSIQDKDNIIAENYFDLKMTELTDEYCQILNYYKNEE